MSVAIDCTVLHGAFSGVEKAVRGLLRGLTQTAGDDELHLICGREPPLDLSLPPSMTWRPMAFDPASRLRRILFQQLRLGRTARDLGAEALHGPAYVTPLRSPLPAIASVYDLMVLIHPGLCARANRIHYGLVLPRALPRCARIIVPSNAVADSVAALPGVAPDRIEIIPLGIDDEFHEPLADGQVRALRQRLQLPDRFLLFVGNQEPKKGLEVLVRALVRLPLAPPLVIAGKRAWGMGGLDDLIRDSGLSESIIFTGYLPDEDLPPLYAAAEWLVFPSIYEGFGLPPLESMACGTPVIASDGGALPETTGDACVRVPAGRAGPLAEAIEACWADPGKRESLIRKGRKQARRFSWRTHAQAVRKVYAEVRGGH
jgi:glycosyltransferase involved in cell wall biosynthesis